MIPAEKLIPGITHMFLVRVAWLVGTFNILPDFVFNMDETGVCMIPSSSKSWSSKGGRFVDVFGADEKRQFSVSPIINALGRLVGSVQVIWGGKTRACEPN